MYLFVGIILEQLQKQKESNIIYSFIWILLILKEINFIFIFFLQPPTT